ncbi:MAG TPA: hypothetical protein VGI10_16070 [Polyangiaceae bacterium]
MPGASDAWQQIAAPKRAPKLELHLWSGYAELAAWPALNALPFASKGHPPGLDVDVFVSASSSGAYQTLVTDSVLLRGTIIAELSHDHAAPSARGYVMQKGSDDLWSYAELDGRGMVLAEGALAACEGCHALAPSDHVFGLPRAP